MKNVSADKKGLISLAKARGVAVSSKQLDRWRLAQLLPATSAQSDGRGKGVRRTTPPNTIDQLIALVSYIKSDRSLDYAAFRLWIDGFSIPLPRVKLALKAVIPKSTREEIKENAAKWDGEIERLSENLSRRRGVPQRVRGLASDGSLADMFSTMLTAATGGTVNAASANKASLNFQVATGVDKARTDAVPGGEPWLTEDPQASILDAFQNVLELSAALESANEDDFIAIRSCYLHYQRFIRMAQVVQDLRGENAFGFAALTESPLAQKQSTHEMTMFVVLAMYYKQNPTIADTLQN